MTDETSLLAAILADPAEDTVRLAYADWCDENERPERARLIRDQIAHSTRGKGGIGFAPGVPCLFGWFKGELCGYVADGVDEKPEASLWVYVDCPGKLHFTRGFVSEVTCDIAAFLQHAKELFARHPVTAVKLSDREPREIPGFPGESIWTWDCSARDRESPSTLPPELWRYAGWVTPDAAKDWLSRQCVDFGRILAGLPSLRARVAA